MKKIAVIFLMVLALAVSQMNMVYPKADVYTGIEEPTDLYGQSALLMDADTGRVLFEKDGYRRMPMASTTKIMTCLVALEQANPESTVTVSALAASQPNVQMNICEGEQYRLIDLLHGLMLESYNDVAVAVAEHVAGSVEAFADLMNQRAAELGCTDSYFITPNGLDAEDENGIHSTTAHDLALILSCAIKNETFLEITQAQEYTITELEGKRTVTANNHNTLLQTMEGAISGKTGFTGNAGYCYAGAVKRDDRTFVAVTLASGWPPHKTYKWSDMEKLFAYGFEHFHYHTFHTGEVVLPESIRVINGQTETISATAVTVPSMEEESFSVLLRDDEKIAIKVELPDVLTAPVEEKEEIGTITYTLNGELIKEKPVIAENAVLEKNFKWHMEQILRYFFDKNLPVLPESY